MSGRRISPARRRAGIGALIAAAIVAALLLLLTVRLLPRALRLTRTGGSGEPDPQFAEPAQAVTRPPEADAGVLPPQLGDDPSARWEQGELTPVDKTADELAREAGADG